MLCLCNFTTLEAYYQELAEELLFLGTWCPLVWEGAGRCSCATCPQPGAAGNAVFGVVWACCLQGELGFFFKLLSLTVRQAPSFNKFLAYLKVVDTPCVSELCASRAGCCGLGVSAAPVLWLCERQKQMFLCCFSALHKGEVCPALPGPL